MSTITIYTCPNPNCSSSTEFHSPGKCPKCGTWLEAQKSLELEKEDEREM